MPSTEAPYRVLIPVLSTRRAADLLAVGSALLKRRRGVGSLLSVVEVPHGEPVSRGVTVARRYRRLLNRITQLEEKAGAGFGVEVRVASNVAHGIREAVYERQTDVLVLEWPGTVVRPGAGGVIANLVADPPADLVLVRPDEAGVPLDIERILVPVRGGPSARLALQTAEALADANDAELTVLHVYRPGLPTERRRREADHFRVLVADLDYRGVRLAEVESDRPGNAILEQASGSQVTVLGAQAELSRSPALVSSALARTVRRLPGTVLVAKSARLVARAEPRLAEEVSYHPPISERQLSARVDRWFAENTFHAREFSDIERLAEAKRRSGLTLSLGLPTLNEEATIGKILRRVKDYLMERHHLLDEVVVIDSGSTDRTVTIARQHGVEVVQHREILPEYGAFAGKGEALWKSLHHLRGDVIAWCDTDISNFHPRFVYGVIGPLLTDPRISYVKGFYKRPLRFGTDLLTAGGGRVTELTARPVINLFYPELSGVVQPLSGEYAGRREVLEELSFFTGYGVEIGLLIDILETYGLNSIAQVDLGVRIHRNQELFDLSKMAFAIMQVAVRRLGDRHRIHLVEEVNRSMKLIHYDSDRFFLELKDIQDHERPPLRSVPEYLARRHELHFGWRERVKVVEAGG